MVGGFNTNARYRGRMFHVQTEDSGQGNPQIITLLYEGGAILTSRKQSYEERIGSDDLEGIVKELMEEQHRAVLRELRSGALDEVLDPAPDTASSLDVPETVVNGAAALPHGPGGFGKGVISGRRLDEVILAHLGAL
jgi:hypothetical protein